MLSRNRTYYPFTRKVDTPQYQLNKLRRGWEKTVELARARRVAAFEAELDELFANQ